MPHLTSEALRQDPEGLAFLRSVLRSAPKAPTADTAVAALHPLLVPPLPQAKMATPVSAVRAAGNSR
jgi:hypothetical protein